MKTKMNLRWRWLLGLSLMLCWLGGSGPNAVQAQESVRMAADKMVAPAAAQQSVMAGMKAMVAPMPETPAPVAAPATAPGKVVASVPTADLPTVKVAQYRRGRKSAQPDTMRFTAVWAAGPEDEYPFAMLLAGEGEGVIDWGDGKQTPCSAVKNEEGTDYAYKHYGHIYADEADGDKREITVYTSSPDLQIVGLQLYYYTNYDAYTLHSSVDVRACPSLKYLYCGNNWLGALDLTRNTALEELGAARCRLTSLTLPQSAALKMLGCGGNQLTSLDVSGCPGLTQLYCWNNQLTSLDVSACTALDTMQCSGNQLGWATLDELSKLNCSWLVISPQELPSLSVNLNEEVDLSEYATYNGVQTVFDLSYTSESYYTVENNILKINHPGTYTIRMRNPGITLKEEAVLITRPITAWAGNSDTLRWVWTVEDVSEPATVSYFYAMGDAPFIVDWGNGQKDTGSIQGQYYQGWLANSYAEAGEYTVAVYGLGHFAPLNFQLGNSNIKALDVRNCPSLTTLQCSGNQLTKLDLSKNTALTGVYVDNNQLTSLDLSACPSLEILYCSQNQLTSLDVSACPSLKTLHCSYNQLTELGWSQNTVLETLYCTNNKLASLDVTKNTALTSLYCNDNQLTELDLTKNTALIDLDCSNNQLTELDVTENTVLMGFACENNQLTSLDVSQNTALRVLHCYSNQLTELDVTENTALEGLSCSHNQLTSLDVTKNTALESFDCTNNQLTELDVTQNTALVYLYVAGNQLTSLDVTKNTVLDDLYCQDNQLTSLDVSQNTALRILQCQYNQLTELDVTQNTALEGLDCSHNQLTSLDVSQNTALWYVSCENNQLGWADLDALSKREIHTCYYSPQQLLFDVDVDEDIDLTAYVMYNGQETEFSFSMAPNDYEFEDGHLKIKQFGDCLVRMVNPAVNNGHYVVIEAQVNCWPADAVSDTAHWVWRAEAGQTLSFGATFKSDAPFMVDWGDGQPPVEYAYYTFTNLRHEYAEAGNYEVKVYGTGYYLLTGLSLYGQGQSLDLRACTYLKSLQCDHNELSSLDVSVCPLLEQLYCRNNRLTELDVTKNTALKELYCDANQLTSLTVNPNTAFRSLSCGYNQLGWAALNALAQLPEDAILTLSPQRILFQLSENNTLNLGETEYATYDGQETAFYFPGKEGTIYEYEDGILTVKRLRLGGYTFTMFNSAVKRDDWFIEIQGYIENEWPEVSDTLRWVWTAEEVATTMFHLKFSNDSVWFVDWGDGEISEYNNTGEGVHPHDYDEAGTYEVAVYGAKHFVLYSLHLEAYAHFPVQSLDVRACPSLEELYCTGNQLTELDLSKNEGLTIVHCGENKLPFGTIAKIVAEEKIFSPQHLNYAVNLRLGSALLELPMVKGSRANVEVERNGETLEEGTGYTIENDSVHVTQAGDYTLKVWHDLVKEQDWSQNEEVYYSTAHVNAYAAYEMAECSFTIIEEAETIQISFAGTPGGSFVIDWGDGERETIEETTGEMLEYTHVYWTKYKMDQVEWRLYGTTAESHILALNKEEGAFKNGHLDVSACPELTSLDWVSCVDCDNGLTALNVGPLTKLEKLYCGNNRLTSLDVSACTALTDLRCSNNQLTSLDVSQNTALMILECQYNRLTSLDVTENTALEWLSCEDNQLTSLDVSACTALTRVTCTGNQLASLDLTQNTALEVLFCEDNRLTSLDLTACPSLVALYCGFNRLESLNVSQNTSLKDLSCYNNRLTSLDVTNNTALTELYCSANLLTSLDVSACPLLEQLLCNSNQLTSLDLTQNTALKELNCDYNGLTALALPQGVTLDRLACTENRLPFAALANISATQKFLSPQYLALDTIDVQDGITLPMLNYSPVNVEVLRGDELLAEGEGYTVRLDSIFYKLYFAQAGDYRLIQWHDALLENYYNDEGDIAYDGEAIATRVYHDTTLVTVTGNNVPDPVDDYDLAVWTWTKEGNGALETNVSFAGTEGGSFVIDWGDGVKEAVEGTGERVKYTHIYDMAAQVEWQLYATTPASRILELEKGSEVGLADETLDVSACPELTYLAWESCEDCGGLTALDVSKNLKLTLLDCYNNRLTSLDVTKNTALTAIYCGRNPLTTSLDVTQNTALVILSCPKNQLTSLDVTKNTALKVLNGWGNQLTSLDVTKNTALEIFYCYDNQLTSLDVTKNTKLEIFYCYNNQLTSLDVTENAALKEFGCSSNRLTSLDITRNTALTWLNCEGNLLTSFDVTKNTALTSAGFSDNQLVSLDMTKNTALKKLYCNRNQLTSLALPQSVTLDVLSCSGNRLPFAALANISATQKYLTPQSLFDTINVQDGITLPMVNGTRVNVEVWREDELLTEGEDYVVLLDSIFYKLYFAQADDHRLIQWHDALLENYESVVAGDTARGMRVYHDTTYVTVTGNNVPDPVDDYDLAVWTWTKEGNGALETNVSFAGTEGGSFVIDWGDGVKEAVEGTGERVKYTHIYDGTAQVGPADTVFGLGRTGQIEWQLYATTPESRILELVKVSEVGLADETLDVSACPELTFLGWVGCEDCGGGLTALDVSQNLKLENLYCYYNQLTELDVTKNTALTLLSCHYNQLTSLNLTRNTALTLLSCHYNQLTSLDVTKNTLLTSLSCSYNPLMSLDVTKNTKLESLWCYDNRLAALDVMKNTALTLLSCGGNQLKSLDVTQNMALERLICYDNQLTSLDVTRNTALLELYCGNNLLTSLDVTQNVMLESLNCYGDPLTSLDVTKNTALTFLNCRYNQLTSLDLTQNLMLETLYCGDNELTSLEVSQNTALALLSCNHNQLTSLDVSDCMALEVLICNHNQLTALNLPQDAKLETLACDSNAMPLSVLATFKDVEAACLSPQQIACETQPGKVLDLRSEMRIGATQTVYTVLKDGKPVDSTAYTMNADGVYGQLRFKTPGQYRLSLSNAEVTETYTVLDSGYYNLNETPQPVYVYYDIKVELPIVQGSGAGWMWLASAGAEKQITFEGSEKGFRIDWGDESSSDVESGLATHRYAEGGVYTVKIESLNENGRLTSLNVSNGDVAMIWFEDATQLKSLNCSGNQLTALDLSALSNLTDYNCARNLFTSLDLTSLAQLQTVDFSGNQLTTVSLPSHSNLKAVKGTDNHMRLSTLYGLLSQRVEKASYGFDPQGDSVYVMPDQPIDLSAEMNIGGNTTTYVVTDADGRPVQASDYTETNGTFRFPAAGQRYKVTLMNMGVMEYQNGNPQKPVTFVLEITVSGVANEDLAASDACVYVRNRTICLSEDLGEMRVYTSLGRCIYKGNGLVAEVPCAGLYVVQAGGHTWKVVVR